ncbi:MAG: hypothetical protein BECKG1743D_GA0114223_108452 [Candidatus Kentron sp. G]|nr:MAG: hypothetical protein BECKG1743F_GA0114225_106791 [Candidatus Kentron sp. G]VFN06317.1 MAG: hypothetical protein BECKG1743D_GA0114223_108452 [Candidatus Kentron sp. G]
MPYNLLSSKIIIRLPCPEPLPEPSPEPLPPHFHAAPEALAGRFVGREREFAELDAAWAGVLSGESPDPDQPPARVVGIIAWGGFGKSALARQWPWRRFESLSGSAALQGGSSFGSAAFQGGTNGIEAKSRPGERRSTALFWWGFQEGQGGVDDFALALLRYLADDPALGLTDIPPDSSGRLARLRRGLAGREYLLVLDGLEGEQDALTRGEGPGGLKSAFLRALLREQAAGRLGQGLVVVTSRLALIDLDRRGGGYLAMDLEDRPLSRSEAGLLLRQEGVEELPEPELTALLATIGPHPLALATMAGFLVRHNQGSATGWQRFQGDVLDIPEGREQERKLWRVLAWSAQLLRPDERRVATAIARFREPVRAKWLLHLLAPQEAPVVAREEETIEARWQRRLEQAGEDPAEIEAFLQQFRGQSEAERAKTEAWLEENFGELGAAPVYPGQPNDNF